MLVLLNTVKKDYNNLKAKVIPEELQRPIKNLSERQGA